MSVGILQQTAAQVRPGNPRTLTANGGQVLLLIVNPDTLTTRVVSAALEENGHEVIERPDMAGASAAIKQHNFDLALLMCQIAEADCLSRCKDCLLNCNVIERESSVPVIVMGRADNSKIKTRARQAGASDYIVWPVEPAEFLARVEAVLRMTARSPTRSASLEIAPGIELDLDRHAVNVRGQQKHLSTTEFKLLAYLARHPGRICSRKELVHAVWGSVEAIGEREVDVFICYLRKKLDDNLHEPGLLVSVRGSGYGFEKCC
jgi:DNA-binding response OmpR family regulator